MQFNKINFLTHLVEQYVQLGKLNGFTNNKDNDQVSGKSTETQIDFGKWILLNHLLTIGTEGMKCEGHTRFSKGCVLAYLTKEIDHRKTKLNEISGIEKKIESSELSVDEAIKVGAIKAMEELKAYILLK